MILGQFECKNVWKIRFFVNENHSNPIGNCMQFPYTHRLESGNIPFRNMQNICTGLENAFAGPGWLWKPHKSKDHIFLHRNYTQKKFATPKKIIFFRDRNFFSKKNVEEKIRENFSKNPKKCSRFFQNRNF